MDNWETESGLQSSYESHLNAENANYLMLDEHAAKALVMRCTLKRKKHEANPWRPQSGNVDGNVEENVFILPPFTPKQGLACTCFGFSVYQLADPLASPWPLAPAKSRLFVTSFSHINELSCRGPSTCHSANYPTQKNLLLSVPCLFSARSAFYPTFFCPSLLLFFSRSFPHVRRFIPLFLLVSLAFFLLFFTCSAFYPLFPFPVLLPFLHSHRLSPGSPSSSPDSSTLLCHRSSNLLPTDHGINPNEVNTEYLGTASFDGNNYVILAKAKCANQDCGVLCLPGLSQCLNHMTGGLYYENKLERRQNLYDQGYCPCCGWKWRNWKPSNKHSRCPSCVQAHRIQSRERQAALIYEGVSTNLCFECGEVGVALMSVRGARAGMCSDCGSISSDYDATKARRYKEWVANDKTETPLYRKLDSEMKQLRLSRKERTDLYRTASGSLDAMPLFACLEPADSSSVVTDEATAQLKRMDQVRRAWSSNRYQEWKLKQLQKELPEEASRCILCLGVFPDSCFPVYQYWRRTFREQCVRCIPDPDDNERVTPLTGFHAWAKETSTTYKKQQLEEVQGCYYKHPEVCVQRPDNTSPSSLDHDPAAHHWELHHLDPCSKLLTIGRTWEAIDLARDVLKKAGAVENHAEVVALAKIIYTAELSKTVVVCTTCHRLETFKVSPLSRRTKLQRRRQEMNFELKQNKSCRRCKLEVSELNHFCFDWDHVDYDKKESDVSAILFRATRLSQLEPALKRAKKEIKRCVLLCANCHRQSTREGWQNQTKLRKAAIEVAREQYELHLKKLQAAKVQEDRKVGLLGRECKVAQGKGKKRAKH